MNQFNTKAAALDYHENPKPGKVEVKPTKPTQSQEDLSLAYSPGVADPCRVIYQQNDEVFRYTNKANTVGVISNGSAVLGLGNLGPEASKPVMEGKGVLFKVFGGVDVYDLELDANDPETFIQAVKAMGPTFGGINLEDIKAPECFEIEKRLKTEMDIPVMHDDQHGTAIITGAALLNALTIANKSPKNLQVVVNGAGAAAVASARFFQQLGVKQKNIVMVDSKGVITQDREGLTPTKQEFATDRPMATLSDALQDADVFMGLSVGNILSEKMLKSMADNPIVFALANPTPEIPYYEAKTFRNDVLIATGRSDCPNQVNNVLGFPYIFRGALDVRATQINYEMKLAAARAIADLAKKPVLQDVLDAYQLNNISFGHDYLIPKPNDSRLITYVAPAVAKAAMDTGVNRASITDWDAYNTELQNLL